MALQGIWLGRKSNSDDCLFDVYVYILCSPKKEWRRRFFDFWATLKRYILFNSMLDASAHVYLSMKIDGF